MIPENVPNIDIGCVMSIALNLLKTNIAKLRTNLPPTANKLVTLHYPLSYVAGIFSISINDINPAGLHSTAGHICSMSCGGLVRECMPAPGYECRIILFVAVSVQWMSTRSCEYNSGRD